MLFGLLSLPWWGYILVILGLTQITIFSVTIYLHRCQAHRALTLHPIVSHFFRFWLWLTTGMVTKEWAAIHRKHHARVETEEDPHSPITKGIRKVFFQGAELYRAESKNKETIVRYGEGTPDDWVERNVYSKYSALGITIMLLLDVALFGVLGVTIWAIQMAWIPLWAAGVVNGIGHYWGYRNFESKDTSRNIIPIGFFIGGEELHNNHHAYASSAKFSAKWWEVDTGWGLIRLLQFFRLAKPKRVLPKIKTQPAKSQIDLDTLKAIFTYRLQVMAHYAREVIKPTLREAKRTVANKEKRELLSHATSVLVPETTFMRSIQKQKLASLLDHFQHVRIVYQFKMRLQEIWNKSTASQKELLEALQEWCKQAEATRIETLHRFALHLKTYVPQQGAV